MPDDTREPFAPPSIDRMAIELPIVQWQTVTQVLSLAPYVRVWQVLQEIERQARALDAQRATGMRAAADAEMERHRNATYRAQQEREEQRTRAQKAEEELRALKRNNGDDRAIEMLRLELKEENTKTGSLRKTLQQMEEHLRRVIDERDGLRKEARNWRRNDRRSAKRKAEREALAIEAELADPIDQADDAIQGEG